MRKRIIAIDFDGTLSLGEYPSCGPANEKLVSLLKRILSLPRGGRCCRYVLWTCRKGQPLDDAIEWLKEQGIVFDDVNELPPDAISFDNDSRKLFYDLFIDDKAVSPEDFISKTAPLSGLQADLLNSL